MGRGCQSPLQTLVANLSVLFSPNLASHGFFFFFWKATVFVLFLFLLWGNAAASELKHQLFLH